MGNIEYGSHRERPWAPPPPQKNIELVSRLLAAEQERDEQRDARREARRIAEDQALQVNQELDALREVLKPCVDPDRNAHNPETLLDVAKTLVKTWEQANTPTMSTMTTPVAEGHYPTWDKTPIKQPAGQQVPQELRVKLLHPDAKMPTRANPGDAGLDLFSCVEGDLGAGDPWPIRLGIAIEIPRGHVGLIMGRSGAASRGEYHAVQTGVIDSGYRGEIKALLHFDRDTTIKTGDKVAQLVIVPAPLFKPVQVETLSESERGDKGFGSTGR